MTATDRMPHPGRNSAERRALDRIGCGEPPACAQKTLKNLLAAGLIVEAGSQFRRDTLGKYKIPNFEMPIPVHMAWCSAVAASDREAAFFDAELESWQ